MAFNDLPVIDPSSRNSNTSEIALEGALRQDRGFISRKEIPDKGIDYEVELILDNDKGSSWKFPVQLKSVEKMRLVSNGKFVSYPFETSRLGLLMKRPPSMGIIALYSVESEVLYFDFVDKIYQRLMEDRESDDWKNNEKVNIRIPCKNVLDGNGAQHIHAVFLSRFEQAWKMQNAHGHKYNLPSANATGTKSYDFTTVEGIKAVLNEYGLALLNNYDLSIVHQLISQIPYAEVCADNDLLKIAAVSYSETGYYAESQIFCNRLQRNRRNSTDVDQTIEFVRLKNELGLGEISTDIFIEKAKKLKETTGNEQNKITLEINITFFALLNIKAFAGIPSYLLSEIRSIYKRIDESNIEPRSKNLLKVWNTENLSILVNTIQHEAFAELRIRESMGDLPIAVEQKQSVLFLASLLREFFSAIASLYKIASDSSDKLLSCYIISLHTRFLISKEIEKYAFSVREGNDGEEHQVLLHNAINNSLTAYSTFLEQFQLKDAHSSLCNCLELLEISRNIYGLTDEFNRDSWIQEKERLENALGLPIYNLAIPKLIETVTENNARRSEGGMRILKDFDDAQITGLANHVLHALKLPEERLVNIVNEMKAHRLFYSRCSDPNIEILQSLSDQTDGANLYRYPIKFVLRSKKSDLITHESYDMDELLKCWSM